MTTALQVTDECGAVHTLTKKLGSGGQGDVWLVQGARRIVKLLHAAADAEALRRQFAFVRRLDLAGLHVAKPIAVLKPPHVGYIAEFLSDMVPIQTLMDPPGREIAQWWTKTGGLRRRLRLLAHAGEMLSALHAKGVAYADLSPTNVFVSAPVHAQESWLIDLDNLRYDSVPSRAIYTPGYGAPEVVNQTHGCTTLSDAWSFAVLVWRTLTLHHPFIGDWVNDGEPELEEQAFAGQVPWVRHSTDDRNRCSTGLPAEHVLGSRLIQLAQQMFENGINDRKLRPGVSNWVERLHAAADQTVTCSDCRGSYFVTEKSCFWCDAPVPAVTPVRIVRWEPGKGILEEPKPIAQLPLTDSELVLTRRTTEGLAGLAGRAEHVVFVAKDRGFTVGTRPGSAAWVAAVERSEQKPHDVSARPRTVPRDGWMVFFDEPTQPQRVALIGRSK